MNVSVEPMNDVINSVGPQQEVSIVVLISEEGDQSLHQLTVMMEELPDDVLNRTLTPDLNITGHIIEEVIEPTQQGPQPAVCPSAIPAIPVRILQPAVCSSTIPAVPVRVQRGMENPFVSTYGQASTDDLKSYERMTDAVDPFPTSGHSPDTQQKDQLISALQSQMASVEAKQAKFEKEAKERSTSAPVLDSSQ
jgi:hypothetical protein